ncbi:hypothetical protein [Nocardia farcinica]|uniref:hypothetical protein n=1 Tax=Nocardia farcinica TaxID=37329 RepID=UPI00245838C5|nr:hypothetical protein [Nocardia farcinica]
MRIDDANLTDHAKLAEFYLDKAMQILRPLLEDDLASLPSDEAWVRARTLQGQAQVHATLALREQLSRLRGAPRGPPRPPGPAAGWRRGGRKRAPRPSCRGWPP